MRTETAIDRVRIAINIFALDLEKNFFLLDKYELRRLERCRQATGYDGRNALGRSKCRQFWYYLNWGWKKFQKSAKGAH